MKGDLNMRNYDRMEKRRKSFTPVWEKTKRQRDNLERQAGIENTQQLKDNGRTQKIRDLYFSVTDPVIRRALMIVERKDYDATTQFSNRGVEEAEAIVWKAQARADIPFRVWLVAAVCGFVAVAAGQEIIAGFTGAIGGGVAGCFIGQGIVAKYKGWARRRLEIALRDLDDERADAAEVAAEPPMFSSDEEVLGEPNNGSIPRRHRDIDDNVFDRAFANMDELDAMRAVREAGKTSPPTAAAR
jgi:hypothetical protein